MNKRMNRLVERFSDESYYIQKKAKYTLQLLLFIYVYASSMFLIDILVYKSYIAMLSQFLFFTMAMFILFQLWLHKHIELATNLAALFGFLFAIYLFFEPVSLRFYMQLLMTMIVTTAGFIKVYQFVVTFMAISSLLVFQSLYYLLGYASKSHVIIDWNSHLLSSLGITVLVISLYYLKVISEKELMAASKIKEIMEQDELTGLPNRRKFTRQVDNFVGMSNMGLLMIDIDHFKEINDKYGHSIGDQVLVEFSTLMKEVTRNTDYVYRWGGEEFVMILMGESEPSSIKIAERICDRIEAFDFSMGIDLTISIGLVNIPNNTKTRNMREYIHQADQALYQAKEKGRNQVVVY